MAGSVTIHITQYDKERLLKLLLASGSTEYRGSEYLKRLQKELERAAVVTPQEIPGDVITMNSTVCLEDMASGDEEIYTLVFPEDADLAQGKISILAPIGTGMLGYRVGDVFEWDVPAGKRQLLVKRIIFQPEASGNYDL
jgi:regulator of nucleoside diphosphate kinase